MGCFRTWIKRGTQANRGWTRQTITGKDGARTGRKRRKTKTTVPPFAAAICSRVAQPCLVERSTLRPSARCWKRDELEAKKRQEGTRLGDMERAPKAGREEDAREKNSCVVILKKKKKSNRVCSIDACSISLLEASWLGPNGGQYSNCTARGKRYGGTGHKKIVKREYFRRGGKY